MRYAQIVIVFLLVHCFQPAAADYYLASLHEAGWQFDQGQGFCRLKHHIPLYGSAEILQQAGEALQFSVMENRPKPLVLRASLAARPAPWIHDSAAMPYEYQVYLDHPDDHLEFGRLLVYEEAAEAMIDALLQGQYPTFTYVRSSGNNFTEETQVAVSSIKFAEAYQQFVSCRNTMAVKVSEQAGATVARLQKAHAKTKAAANNTKKPNRQIAQDADREKPRTAKKSG